MTSGEAGSDAARDWARFNEPHFRPIYEVVHDRLGIEHRVPSGCRLLDVGCGPGGAALLAANRGAQVAGLDVSPDSIEVARERVSSGDFRVGDMESLPWPDGFFDAVTGFNAFQFARSPVAALTESRRVLAPGGKLGMVIWAPREESQQSRIMAAINALAPPRPPGAPGPFALSAPGVAESVLEAAGLRFVDRGEVPIVVDYPDAQATCRVMMAGSGGVRAIQHVGEERVRQVILEALEEFKAGAGGYLFENRFRFLIAEYALAQK